MSKPELPFKTQHLFECSAPERKRDVRKIVNNGESLATSGMAAFGDRTGQFSCLDYYSGTMPQ